MGYVPDEGNNPSLARGSTITHRREINQLEIAALRVPPLRSQMAILAKPHNVSNIKLGSTNKHLWPLTKRHRRELMAWDLAAEFSAYFQPPSKCAGQLSVAFQCAER